MTKDRKERRFAAWLAAAAIFGAGVGATGAGATCDQDGRVKHGRTTVERTAVVGEKA